MISFETECAAPQNRNDIEMINIRFVVALREQLCAGYIQVSFRYRVNARNFLAGLIHHSSY
jgi:hypothetical protein